MKDADSVSGRLGHLSDHLLTFVNVGLQSGEFSWKEKSIFCIQLPCFAETPVKIPTWYL